MKKSSKARFEEESSFERDMPISYSVEDRKAIARRYHIGQEIQIEKSYRDEFDKSLRTYTEPCIVAGKYPFLLRYIDPHGQSNCIDYFKLDQMSRRIREKGMQDVH